MSNLGEDTFAELKAMEAVATALENVDEATRLRVLRWATSRYVGMRGPAQHAALEKLPGEQNGGQPSDVPMFEHSGELLAAAGAETESDKALVIGYWFQVVLNQGDLESQAMNTELKHLGHGLSNITRALDQLMHQRPQLVIQLRKAGTSKQARKKYKLTNEGIKRVRQMLAQPQQDSDDFVE